MAKSKGPKGKDLSVFVRFGGLDLKTQKGYSSKDNATFHSPPASRGFYAMPKVIQEFFLIGSLDSYQPGIMPQVPKHLIYPEDESPENLVKWEKSANEFDWITFEKKKRNILSEIRKEFRKIDGNIWHHLGANVPNNEVLERKGSWVKTTIKTWQKAFNKESLNNRYGEDFGTGTGRGEQSLTSARGLTGMYSKDQYEVFFDEKV